MSPSTPQTHFHPNPLSTLAPHLISYLPQSLPLLRRLQFHHSSPSARVIATFPSNLTPPSAASFAASYVDRTRAPETECWIFSSYEVSSSETESQDHDDTQQQQRKSEARTQLLALLSAIADLPDSEPLMVVGSLNETLVELLLAGKPLIPQKVIRRKIDGDEAPSQGLIDSVSIPYMKWLIAPPSELSDESHDTPPTLPEGEGYTFSTVQGREEIALTISRTHIPKTEATLSTLGNVGIRYIEPSLQTKPQDTQTPPAEEGKLVAWAFLGVDGSLTSLHVEPAHRGKGLAKAVSKMLFRRLVEDPVGMGFRPVEFSRGEGSAVGVDLSLGWAASDVALENRESAGVARGLGGTEGWGVRWVGVDLRRVDCSDVGEDTGECRGES